ncbi:hypothetical protein NKG05_14110 [Oerskovia sp. M15]
MWISLRAAQMALPVSPSDRQDVLAVAIIAGERMLDQLEKREPGTRTQASQDALDMVPRTAAWAESFCRGSRLRPRGSPATRRRASWRQPCKGSPRRGPGRGRRAVRAALLDDRGGAGLGGGRAAEALEPSDWEPVVKSVGAQV